MLMFGDTVGTATVLWYSAVALLVMGCSAVGRGKGIGPAGKHQPSGNVVRQSPTMRLASAQAYPQVRWGSPSAALRRREKTTGSIGVHRIGTGPWALT
jgi:hypothetical protein